MKLGRAVRYGGVYSDKGPPRLLPVGCLSGSLPEETLNSRLRHVIDARPQKSRVSQHTAWVNNLSLNRNRHDETE